MRPQYIIAMSLFFVASAPNDPALANQAFDACVRKLCVSAEQGDCWIKAGADLCKKPGKQCTELEDHTGAKVIRKTGKFWEMETGKGTGFVNERWMMVSGDLC